MAKKPNPQDGTPPKSKCLKKAFDTLGSANPFSGRKKTKAAPPANDNTAPKAPRPGLKAMFGKLVREVKSLNRQDLRQITFKLANDLRKPKQAGILLAAIVIPGGLPVWMLAKIHDHRKNHPANDDSATQKKEPPKPGSAKPPGR